MFVSPVSQNQKDFEAEETMLVLELKYLHEKTHQGV